MQEKDLQTRLTDLEKQVIEQAETIKWMDNKLKSLVVDAVLSDGAVKNPSKVKHEKE